ncbi:MAG TPA: hypothetical protein VG651_00385 [Stellaceae bacterium]|nr:hypothetical protein [Stellaceae bacterium]
MYLNPQSRQDLYRALRKMNAALDALQGGEIPERLTAGWRRKLFDRLKTVVDEAREIERDAS